MGRGFQEAAQNTYMTDFLSNLFTANSHLTRQLSPTIPHHSDQPTREGKDDHMLPLRL